jgi:hypothetical protein
VSRQRERRFPLTDPDEPAEVDRGAPTRERDVLPWREASCYERNDAPDVCAQCGQPVIDNQREPAVLICLDCLVKDAPPSGLIEVHPDNDPMHCPTCFDAASARGWNGSRDTPQRWWGA